MQPTIFISHASADSRLATELCSGLEQAGIPCWLAPRDVAPGEEYGSSLIRAIDSSQLVVVVLSHASNLSPHVAREIERAKSRQIAVLPYLVDDVELSGTLSYFLSQVQSFDGRGPVPEHLERFIATVRGILPSARVQSPELVRSAASEHTSKGYVFISYVRGDQEFVQELRDVLRRKRYGYWDYTVGSRDYHGKLYRELEERIDNAVAFLTVVSDAWRESDWVAAEFLYARESQKPIFVIQAKPLKKPLPMLLNLQTRIDMSHQFERGADVLATELGKKGL